MKSVTHLECRANIVTQGIVSDVRARPLNNYKENVDFVQYDAATNPGNSGGPVFNGAGRVIAMTDAISSTVGNPQSGHAPQSAGIAFGVSSSFLAKAVGDIITYGAVKQGLPRIQLADALPSGRSENDGLSPHTVGAVVQSVEAPFGGRARRDPTKRCHCRSQ